MKLKEQGKVDKDTSDEIVYKIEVPANRYEMKQSRGRVE
jgi:hypothetical protein